MKKAGKVDREKEYLDGIDFRTWWEDFSTSTRKNGTLQYPTVWSFITVKTKVKWQQDLLYWVLGPKVEIGYNEVGKYPHTQFDWETKRQNGFWYSSNNIEQLKDEVKRKATAYDRLQQAGEVNLDSLARLKELQAQINKEFGGRLFLPELSAGENKLRAQLYMDLTKQVIELQNNVQSMYARTQGMDLHKLEHFFEMFAQGMGGQVAEKIGLGKQVTMEKQSGYENVLTKIVDMTLRKSADLEIALPDAGMEEIIRKTPAIQMRKKTVN